MHDGEAMGRILLVALTLASACTTTRSGELACNVTSDCESGRVCDRGFCVTGDEAPVDAPDGTPIDATEIDAPPDADPFAAIEQMCLAAGYTKDATTGGLYRVVTNGQSWVNAQADCAGDVANATHLIVLSSAAEVTFAAATQPGWIGLSDRVTEGTFVTVTGETGDQRPFANGQPDNGDGSDDCIEISSGARLNDDQCGNGKRYLCECDGKPSI